MSHPPPGGPWYPGQPEQNQPQYGQDQPYSGGPAYPQGQQPYGGDPNYGGQQYGGGGGPAYPQESYTTEPPYSGQPYSDQPYSGQPYSGGGYGAPQPGYDAGYQQQAYPPPGQPFAPSGQPGYPTPQPSRNRGGLIALIVGAVVLVLVLCGVGGVLLLRSDDSGNNTANPTTPPTGGGTTAASPTSTVKPEYPATITLPNSLAGLTKITDNPDLQKSADDTASKIKTSTNADSAVAAFYRPGTDNNRIVAMIGATTRISNPTSELNDAFREMSATGVRDVNPGPLGGEMKCGNAVTGGTAFTVCGWADGGSLALGLFFNRSLDDSATLLRQIRSEVLRRG